MKRVILSLMSVLTLAGSSSPALAADWPSAEVIKAILDDPRVVGRIGGQSVITSISVRGADYGIGVLLEGGGLQTSCYLNLSVRGQSRDASGRLKLDLQLSEVSCTPGGASVGNGG